MGSIAAFGIVGSAKIPMRRKLVVGNWKMHGSLAQNASLLGAVKMGAAQLSHVDIAVCAPYPYLAQLEHIQRLIVPVSKYCLSIDNTRNAVKSQ